MLMTTTSTPAPKANANLKALTAEALNTPPALIAEVEISDDERECVTVLRRQIHSQNERIALAACRLVLSFYRSIRAKHTCTPRLAAARPSVTVTTHAAPASPSAQAPPLTTIQFANDHPLPPHPTDSKTAATLHPFAGFPSTNTPSSSLLARAGRANTPAHTPAFGDSTPTGVPTTYPLHNLTNHDLARRLANPSRNTLLNHLKGQVSRLLNSPANPAIPQAVSPVSALHDSVAREPPVCPRPFYATG